MSAIAPFGSTAAETHTTKSVNSEDSSAPVRMSGHRRPANVVEISDSDSEGEASAPRYALVLFLVLA